jgi:hypothetical protein
MEKTKRGRPKKASEKSLSVIYRIRLTSLEKTHYEELAAKEGKNLSEWVRNALKKAAN